METTSKIMPEWMESKYKSCKKELKGNCLYYDKNNQQFLRHKNWWIPDK